MRQVRRTGVSALQNVTFAAIAAERLATTSLAARDGLAAILDAHNQAQLDLFEDASESIRRSLQ